jgi:hypothetical protein
MRRLFLLAIFLSLQFRAAPAQAQFADFSISVNHSTKTVKVQASILLCFPVGGQWRFEWGDGTTTSINSNVIGQYSHTYSSWGKFNIALVYKCFQRSERSTGRIITLVQPMATAVPTNTPVPLTVFFDLLGNYSGNVFISARASRARADIVCAYSGALSGAIRCPHRTLVSFPFSGCGTIKVTATARQGGQSASATEEVSIACAATATPTPLTAGSAAVKVASKNDSNRSVTVGISQNSCTGVGTWNVSWGDGGSADIPSPYSAQHSHSYANWGVFIITLTYTCQGQNQAGAAVNVAFVHPTSTPTATPDPQPTPLESGARRRSGASARLARLAPIPTQDHSCLPAGAEVNSVSPWIAFCEVSGAAISDGSIRNAALSAIDVWGPLGVEAEVCFDGYGAVVSLLAAYSPRVVSPLVSYLRADGKTCARIHEAGTVVLMPGTPSFISPAPGAATASPAPTRNPYLIADSLTSQRALSNCMVSSVEILNFRGSPAGQIMSWFAGTGVALARTRNWFKVSYLGREGWISAHFVTTNGDCRYR